MRLSSHRGLVSALAFVSKTGRVRIRPPGDRSVGTLCLALSRLVSESSLRSSLQRISSSQKHPEKRFELILDSFHEFSCQMAFQLSICKATQQLRHQKTSCRCRFPRMTGLHSFVFSAYTVPLDRVEVDAYVVSVLGSSWASSETLAMERRTSRLDPRRLWLPSSVSFCWMRRVRVSLSAERAATITR